MTVLRRPRTEAGRALLNLYAKQPGPTGDLADGINATARAELSLMILTIEVAAAATALHDYKAAVDALAEILAWVDPYASDLHSYCDLDKGYDYADCSCGLDDRLQTAYAALTRLRETVLA